MEIEQNLEVKAKVTEALALVKSGLVKITSPEDQEKVAVVIRAIKTRVKELEDLRVSMTKPLLESKKRIDEFFKAPISALQKRQDELQSEYIAWDDKCERERKAEEQRLQELARKEEEKQKEKLEKQAEKAANKGNLEKADELLEQAQAVYVPAPVVESQAQKQNGISFQERWTYEITDVKLLPRSYMVADEKQLQQIATATKGTLPIPGVRFFSKKIVAGRTMY